MAIAQEYEAAKKANKERYAQAMQIYDEIISRYRPGGEFQKAQLGELEKRKVRDVGAETQQLISSGMYGTTTTAGLPRKWEAGVGAPSRLKLEDIMMQRLSQAQVGKAGFMERKEDVYPDVGAYAQYAGQAAAAQPRGTTRTVEESPSPWESGFMGGGWAIGDMFGGGGATTAPTTTPAYAPAQKTTPAAPSSITPPPGSPAALWAQGEDVWGKSLEAERTRAGVGGGGQTAGGGVWKRGDYAQWLRVKGVTNSGEAQKAFQAAKGTPK